MVRHFVVILPLWCFERKSNYHGIQGWGKAWEKETIVGADTETKYDCHAKNKKTKTKTRVFSQIEAYFRT